jgi:CRISPR-associated protein Csb2
VGSVLELLAAEPPEFILPRATATHTRSYLNSNTTVSTDKSLVFDSFLVFERPHACFVRWPGAALSSAQRGDLRRLLNQLNYLGRSESWVDADLSDSETPEENHCVPAAKSGAGGELIRIACASPASEYRGKGTWLDALTFSTANLLKERASAPPLLRQVSYLRSESAIETDPPRRIVRNPPTADAIILGLAATVLPLVTTTLEVADQIRTRLMGAHKRRMNGDESAVSPLFSGKGLNGEKRLDHGHIYILPLANRYGRIDRVLIRSPLRPFTADELDAVRGVRELYQRDNRGKVQCVVTWQGAMAACPERSRTLVAESATPFVPPRHGKKNRDFVQFLIDEVFRECANHGLAAPQNVELLEGMPARLFHEVEYRRNRKNDPVRPGYALRLTYAAPVLVPFSIGYGAHFGLGQFARGGRERE